MTAWTIDSGAIASAATAYVRRGACATMLEQEAHVRREGAQEGKKNSELKHRLGCREKSRDREAVFSPHRYFELSVVRPPGLIGLLAISRRFVNLLASAVTD
jgi:hypothetical protein